MFVIRKVFLLAIFLLMTMSITGCFNQPEVDSFGNEKKAGTVGTTSEDGLKLINTHKPEYTSQHKSQYTTEPQ